MANLIYDKSTECARLMVWYDRYGITIRQWSDEVHEDSDRAYHVDEAFFTWEQYRDRERSYRGDDGSGNMKARIVAGAISLMGNWGPSSDSCGEVDSLDEYVNGGHVFTC
jgi:hypothetical protein